MSNSRITAATLYRSVLLAFGLVVAGLIFEQLITLVLAALIVVIIALPLSAAADALERLGIPRTIGATLALLFGLGALAGVVALVVPIFSHEINQFADSLPNIVSALGHRIGRLTGRSPHQVGAQIKQFVSGYTQHPSKLLGPLESVGASVIAAIAVIIVILLTALYTAINPRPLVGGMLRIVPPTRRAQAERGLARLASAYLGWLRGLTIGMVLLGGITYLGLMLVGLPFAAFFAVFTAIAMIVPYFGALVSSIPPILYALTISPGKAAIVAAIYIFAHQLEGGLIQPLVIGRTVKLHPAAIAVGVVAVERLFGFVGLIVAVPILATVKIAVEELWINRIEERDRASNGNLTSSSAPAVMSVGDAPDQQTVRTSSRA